MCATIGLACATRASFLSSPSSSTRNNGEAHQGRAGPRPLAWWTTTRCALTNRLPRVRHAHASQVSPQDGVTQPPTRRVCSCSQATNDEKSRELVIALMGQEPGDEPRRPRTPLLAPFITHDVLLRVNNSLMPPNNAERGGLGLQAALGRAVAALTGAPRRRTWRTPGTRGNAMQARARRAVHALLSRTLTVPDP